MKEKIKAFLAQGLTRAQISKEVGLSASALGHFIRKNSIQCEHRHAKAVREMYVSGHPYKDIVSALGIGYPTISVIVARGGLSGVRYTPQLSREDVFTVFHRYRNLGYTCGRIATEMECSHNKIKLMLDRFATEAQELQILELQKSGAAPVDIAQQVRLSLFAVEFVLSGQSAQNAQIK